MKDKDHVQYAYRMFELDRIRPDSMEELILRIYRKGNEVMKLVLGYHRVTKGSFYSKDSSKPCLISLNHLQLDLLLFKTR